MHSLHREAHPIERIGWLRAAVLGANDGIISTSSLVVGVAAASTLPNEIRNGRFSGRCNRNGRRRICFR
jgi:vacuolar iron transporter family protein